MLLAFIAITLLSCHKSGPAPEVGKQAPEISAVDLNLHTYTLADLKGKVVLINLWSYT
jgi:peroxiredoxin